MGLDMYLNGEIYFHNLSELQRQTQPIAHIFRLGYWRKHPDLHGYIVQEFADGEDNCQEVDLSIDNMEQMIDAINEGRLPHTEGFFFGVSENDEQQTSDAVAIFKKAISWLESEENDTVRAVVYRASW